MVHRVPRTARASMSDSSSPGTPTALPLATRRGRRRTWVPGIQPGPDAPPADRAPDTYGAADVARDVTAAAPDRRAPMPRSSPSTLLRATFLPIHSNQTRPGSGPAPYFGSPKAFASIPKALSNDTSSWLWATGVPYLRKRPVR